MLQHCFGYSDKNCLSDFSIFIPRHQKLTLSMSTSEVDAPTALYLRSSTHLYTTSISLARKHRETRIVVEVPTYVCSNIAASVKHAKNSPARRFHRRTRVEKEQRPAGGGTGT